MRRAAFFLIFAVCAGCDHASERGAASQTAQPRVADASDSSAPPNTADAQIADTSLTKSQRDSVRRQVEQHWLYDFGIADLGKTQVVVVVEMNLDGLV